MSNYTRALVPPSFMLKLGSWRSPIFMVDRIIDYRAGEHSQITTIKHVTFNEPYIPGHFLDNPIMPGVMIAEIFGQTSEYLSLLNDFCKIHQKETDEIITKFDDVAKVLLTEEGANRILKERERVVGVLASQDVKFKHIALPGDTIEATSKIAFQDNNGFIHYDVEARVGRKLICAGKIINFRMDKKTASSKGLQLN